MRKEWQFFAMMDYGKEFSGKIWTLSRDKHGGLNREDGEERSKWATWHHWDPFTFQIAFIIYLHGSHMLRVKLMQTNERVVDQVLPALKFRVSGMRSCWPNALCSNSATHHIQFMRVAMESYNDWNWILCQQEIPLADDGVPLPEARKVIVHLFSLRTFRRLTLEFDLKHGTSMDSLSPSYRVLFLQISGMICVYLPGHFVHFIDVVHPERGLEYLFGQIHDVAPQDDPHVAAMPLYVYELHLSAQSMYVTCLSWRSHDG